MVSIGDVIKECTSVLSTVYFLEVLNHYIIQMKLILCWMITGIKVKPWIRERLIRCTGTLARSS